ncbi:hypothetical protein [Rhizobium terricola]|uniref:hypothetical protein n=1 Tax=Rhizobium terricola TaxID=2728849 RepID=UPI001FEE72D6|nr:hypothetical protein [Rhizobium terricola]
MEIHALRAEFADDLIARAVVDMQELKRTAMARFGLTHGGHAKMTYLLDPKRYAALSMGRCKTISRNTSG